MGKKQIYVIVHHEIFYWRGVYYPDEMAFQVASSVQKALEYIRESHAEPYSWWEIQVTTLDSGEWPEHYGWYGRRGGRLRKRPYEKAVAAYKRCKQDPSHHLNV